LPSRGPQAVADVSHGRGGTWSDAGDILFTPRGGGVVHRVPQRGGTSEPVTTLDASRGENAHYWPVALPGGRRFLFFIRNTRPENSGIYLGSLDGTALIRLVTTLASGLSAPPRGGRPGHLLWVREDDLLAQPLDLEAGRLTGEVITVASDVRVEESQRVTFASVSANGRLVWASARAGDMQFSWHERSGRRLDVVPISRGKIVQPRISPDGRRLAFARVLGGTADIWVHDFASGATTQVTTDPDYEENASWSPDGRRLVFEGQGDRFVMVATLDGSAPVQQVVGQGRPSAPSCPTDAQSCSHVSTGRMRTIWQSLTSIIRAR